MNGRVLSILAGTCPLLHSSVAAHRQRRAAEALSWLERRFTAVVLGNHERPLLECFDPERRSASSARPEWLRRVPRSQYRRWRAALARMPLALTIATAHGPVGLVHADVPHLDWAVAIAMLETAEPDVADIALLGPDACEAEVYRRRAEPVAGLRALVHGHFVISEVMPRSNRWNIDTGASFFGFDRLTLLHINGCAMQFWTFDVTEVC